MMSKIVDGNFAEIGAANNSTKVELKIEYSIQEREKRQIFVHITKELIEDMPSVVHLVETFQQFAVL